MFEFLIQFIGMLLILITFSVALVVFAIKVFEFLFETSWTRPFINFVKTVATVSITVVSSFFYTEKPRYRFNNSTGKSELISEGWGLSQKFGVFLALFWFGFIGFAIVSLFR